MTNGVSGPTEKRHRVRFTARELWALIQKQGESCALTGRYLEPDDAVPDHILPVKRGGTHDISNIQIIHKDVNRAKHTMTQDEFISMCREVVRWVDGTKET